MKKYLVCLAIVAIWPLFAQVVTGPTPKYVPPPNERSYYDKNYYNPPSPYSGQGVYVPYHYDYNYYSNPYGGYGHGYYRDRPHYYQNPHQHHYKGDGGYHRYKGDRGYHNYKGDGGYHHYKGDRGYHNYGGYDR